MGPWSEERTDAWAIQPLMVRRHASPYAFERRAEVEPLVAPAGHAVFSVEALVTNLGPDGAYARFTEADNALYGDARFGSIPLREVDGLGPAWESGRLETQLPGQARPVRLLFTGPADYAPTGLQVRLATAELGHRDVSWSLDQPAGAPPFVRPARGQRPTIAEPATPRPTPSVPEEAPFDPTHNPPPGPSRRGRR
jgi:hypothetical protein